MERLRRIIRDPLVELRVVEGICDAVYRFAPVAMDAAARASIHAAGEKIGIRTLVQGVGFYETLIRKL